ncbi:MAG: hypothetical protein GY742_19215 [Hyphomicrobiales bacterium]|nr:hypothetical protein [Hyphomicrobiales bacterium]
MSACTYHCQLSKIHAFISCRGAGSHAANISNFFKVSQATRNRTTDQLIINLRAMFNSIDIKNLKNEPEKWIAELVKGKLEECQSIKTGTDEQIQNLWDLIFEIEFCLPRFSVGNAEE